MADLKNVLYYKTFDDIQITEGECRPKICVTEEVNCFIVWFIDRTDRCVPIHITRLDKNQAIEIAVSHGKLNYEQATKLASKFNLLSLST